MSERTPLFPLLVAAALGCAEPDSNRDTASDRALSSQSGRSELLLGYYVNGTMNIPAASFGLPSAQCTAGNATLTDITTTSATSATLDTCRLGDGAVGVLRTDAFTSVTVPAMGAGAQVTPLPSLVSGRLRVRSSELVSALAVTSEGATVLIDLQRAATDWTLAATHPVRPMGLEIAASAMSATVGDEFIAAFETKPGSVPVSDVYGGMYPARMSLIGRIDVLGRFEPIGMRSPLAAGHIDVLTAFEDTALAAGTFEGAFGAVAKLDAAGGTLWASTATTSAAAVTHMDTVDLRPTADGGVLVAGIDSGGAPRLVRLGPDGARRAEAALPWRSEPRYLAIVEPDQLLVVPSNDSVIERYDLRARLLDATVIPQELDLSGPALVLGPSSVVLFGTRTLGGSSATVAVQWSPSAACCDDGDPCTEDTLDTNAACTHTPTECDDGNPCTDDHCAAPIGCGVTPLSGGACDDGDPCTSWSQCSSGICSGTVALLCDDGDPQTADVCFPDVGCVNSPPPNGAIVWQRRLLRPDGDEFARAATATGDGEVVIAYERRPYGGKAELRVVRVATSGTLVWDVAMAGPEGPAFIDIASIGDTAVILQSATPRVVAGGTIVTRLSATGEVLYRTDITLPGTVGTLIGGLPDGGAVVAATWIDPIYPYLALRFVRLTSDGVPTVTTLPTGGAFSSGHFYPADNAVFTATITEDGVLFKGVACTWGCDPADYAFTALPTPGKPPPFRHHAKIVRHLWFPSWSAPDEPPPTGTFDGHMLNGVTGHLIDGISGSFVSVDVAGYGSLSVGESTAGVPRARLGGTSPTNASFDYNVHRHYADGLRAAVALPEGGLVAAGWAQDAPSGHRDLWILRFHMTSKLTSLK